MKFYKYGDLSKPHIIMIHGGGNSWWNFLRQAKVLSEKYHVILPIIDGHGEERNTPFVSTEVTADKIFEYIKSFCGGKVFALCGVSLGGQVVIELLSRKNNLAKKAIIDGSLCYPTPYLSCFSKVAIKLFYPLIFSRIAIRFQLKLMPILLPKKMQFTDEIKRYYLQDMQLLPKATMITIYIPI